MNLDACSRRELIKTVAVFTAGALLPAKWSARVSGAVSTPTTGDLGLIRIKIADFPPLLTDYGSVRLGTSPILGCYPTGIFYPLLITRAPGNSFYTLSAECTHASCTLPALNASTKTYNCPQHGSIFAAQGTVINGPATFPLREFKNSQDQNGNLIIEVPDIGFSVEVERVETSRRLRLQFLGFENMEYEAAFRPSLSSPWQPVSFSLTPDGPLDQTVLPGPSDYADLYVDPSPGNGFYAVFLRVRKV
jgi:nitrite reductase/ring-hydroxylating ferredoxin subunit